MGSAPNSSKTLEDPSKLPAADRMRLSISLKIMIPVILMTAIGVIPMLPVFFVIVAMGVGYGFQGAPFAQKFALWSIMALVMSYPFVSAWSIYFGVQLFKKKKKRYRIFFPGIPMLYWIIFLGIALMFYR